MSLVRHITCSLLPLVLPLALAACASSELGTDEDRPAPNATLESELERGLRLEMLPESSAMSVDARWNRGAETVESSVDLVVRSGFVRVEKEASGELVLSDFNVLVDDILVSSDLLHSDIELTDVRIDQPRETRVLVENWASVQGHLNVQMDMALELGWSLRLEDGSVVPLGQQELVEFPLQLQVAMDSEGIYAGFEVFADGALWNWANVVEVYGLQLDLRADDKGPIN